MKSMNRYTTLALFFAGSLLPQPQPDHTSETARKVSRSGSAATRIGPSDTITITAFQAEEISREWRVNSSGELNLPMLGKISAAGMTPDDLQRELVTRLEKYVRDPQVSVFISESRSHPVTVMGAVEKPSVYQLQDAGTLFDVLMLAGGLKNAGETVTVTRRTDQGTIPLSEAKETSDELYSTVDLHLTEVMSGRSRAANLVLRDNDVVSVSQHEPRLVHVIGEVVRPGSVELVNSETVPITKILAAAGGFTRTAVPRKAMIRRIGVEGAKGEAAIVDLGRIVEGKAADLALSEGDVLIIPSNQLMAYIQSISLAAANAGVFSGLQILARF